MFNVYAFTAAAGRCENEDAYVVSAEKDQFIGIDESELEYTTRAENIKVAVCDGLGGHTNGRAASQFVCKQVAVSNITSENILDSMKKINQDLVNQDHCGLTTISACILDEKDRIMCIANAGDTRVYLKRNGVIRQLTRDDSTAELWRRFGDMNEKEIHNLSVLTQCMGQRYFVSKVQHIPLLDQDMVLLMSDGAYLLIDEDVLKEFAACENPGELGKILKNHIDKADDNATLAAIKFVENF